MNIKKRIENLLHFIEVYQCIGADTISKKDLQERHKKTMTKSTSHSRIKQRYVQRAETVQNLLQSGYTKTQIRCLYELIMADYSAKRIKEMFPTNVALEEIKNFAKIL